MSADDAARAAVRKGLTVLGLTPEGAPRALPTASARASRRVFDVHVRDVHARAGRVVVRVQLGPDERVRTGFAFEHEATALLHAQGQALVSGQVVSWNPVPAVAHPEPMDVGGALVAATRFVPARPGPIGAAKWGRLAAVLHTLGSRPAARELLVARGRRDALCGLNATALAEAFAHPGHPLHGDRHAAARFAREVRERVLRALEADPDPLLCHRDLHALNCLDGPFGPVAIDWQEAGWGTRSEDFAWLYLQVTRFGGPMSLVHRARATYRASSPEGACPSLTQIEAAGRLRELVFLGFSLAAAHRDPVHRAEALTELPVLLDPRARTGRWRLLFNPAVFAPGLRAA